MATEAHPPTYEIRVRYTNVMGYTYDQPHFVWDSNRFMQARIAECVEANQKHLKETGKPGLAMVVLL